MSVAVGPAFFQRTNDLHDVADIFQLCRSHWLCFFFNNLRARTVSGKQLLQQATIRFEGNLMGLGHTGAHGSGYMALKRWAVVGDKASKWSSTELGVTVLSR